MTSKNNLPKRMIKVTGYGTITYERTKYGSYVDPNDPFMVQEKNALSYKELVKYGYKSSK